MPKNIESKISLQCYKVIYTQIRHMCSHTQPAEHWNTNTKSPTWALAYPDFQEYLGASSDAL